VNTNVSQNGSQANTSDPASTNSTTNESIPTHGNRTYLSKNSSSSDDRTPKATRTPTPVSKSAKYQLTSTNLSNIYHEVKLPSLSNVESNLYEINKCFDKIWCIFPCEEIRLSLSNCFPNQIHPYKHSIFLQQYGL